MSSSYSGGPRGFARFATWPPTIPATGRALIRLPARFTRARRPRHGYIIARHLIGNVWLYWQGPNRQCIERWTYRQTDAHRHKYSDAAHAAILGNSLPKESLILRVKY